MIPIRTALISVSDKSGLAECARGLARFKIKILSTGGTAKLLAEQGLRVTEVADYTGFPEMLDGRLYRLPGNARRACQDPAPQVARRHPREARFPRALGRDQGGGNRADRPRRRQPLSVRADRREAGMHSRRSDREHGRRRAPLSTHA